MKLIYLFCLSITCFGNGAALYANVLKIGKKCAFTSIISAVHASVANDTLIVQPGVYQENDIYITKPLSIYGEKEVIVDGVNEGKSIFIIQSSNVVIEGLTIINTGSSTIKDLCGIKIEKNGWCKIVNNKFINNYFAVYLSESFNCLVFNNEIKGSAVYETSSGNGIHLWKCKEIEIKENEIYKHRDGVYFEFSEKCKISDNYSAKNVRYGLHFMFSHGNIYERNKFVNNGSGVAVMYTENVTMMDNIFEDNWGAASYGLLLKDITKSHIERNVFMNNTIGIYMEGANDIIFEENKFISNGWAIKFLGNCMRDSLINNEFESNIFDIGTNSFSVGDNNYLSGNYWDKYRGYDLNKDKVGDIPYRPVSLFSVYAERVPFSILLLKSFIVELLEIIENAFPAIIPDTFSDKNPVLRKAKNGDNSI